MNNEIKYSCDNCLFYSNTGCKSNILCIRGSNYFPSDTPNISYQEVKIKKIEKSDEIKRLRTARNTLHILEHRGILENNLSTEQITAIRIAEFALDELYKSKDVQPVKREKWKEILYDAVKELKYYETHGDLLDRHIWKYKNEALALIGKDGDTE